MYAVNHTGYGELVPQAHCYMLLLVVFDILIVATKIAECISIVYRSHSVHAYS
jgi:hypothetical protein